MKGSRELPLSAWMTREVEGTTETAACRFWIVSRTVTLAVDQNLPSSGQMTREEAGGTTRQQLVDFG